MNEDSITNIIDREGEFWIYRSDKKVSGVLFLDTDKVKLRIMHKNIQHKPVDSFLSDGDLDVSVYGSVAGMNVVLTRCIKILSGGGLDWGEEIIEPDLVLFGYGNINHTGVKQVICDMPCLYYFFYDQLIENSLDMRQGYIYKINEEKIGATLLATDSLGELKINRGITYKPFADNSKSVDEVISAEYTFCNEVEILEAIRKIAQVRNFFSFLCGSHIPIRKVQVKFEQESAQVWFNYSDGAALVEKYHFLLPSNQIAEEFDSIWKKWVEFADENIYFVELFFEICCGRSKRVNLFNNLCQMFEMYSRKYRNAEAEAIARAEFYGNSGNANRTFRENNIHLTHRLNDIISLVSTALKIPEEKVVPFAKKIANTRNFYTHYDRESLRYSELDLFSVSRVLKKICELLVISLCVGNIETLSENDIFDRDLYYEDITQCLP